MQRWAGPHQISIHETLLPGLQGLPQTALGIKLLRMACPMRIYISSQTDTARSVAVTCRDMAEGEARSSTIDAQFPQVHLVNTRRRPLIVQSS